MGTPPMKSPTAKIESYSKLSTHCNLGEVRVIGEEHKLAERTSLKGCYCGSAGSCATQATTAQSTFALPRRLASLAEKAWQIALELSESTLLCRRELRHGGQKHRVLFINLD